MSNLKQQMYDLEVKTTEVAKLKAQHLVALIQSNSKDFQTSWDGETVWHMLESLKERIGDIEP